MQHRCFYCWCPLLPPAVHGVHEESSRTMDHIFPKHLLRLLPSKPSFHWRQNNLVVCCFNCNQNKGNMWPLEWLATMESAGGAVRLAKRLALLKVDLADIEVALAARRDRVAA